MSEKLRMGGILCETHGIILASAVLRCWQSMRFCTELFSYFLKKDILSFSHLSFSAGYMGTAVTFFFSSRAWLILLSGGQTWNSIIILEVFIRWKLIHSLILKVNWIAKFNYRNNLAKDVVISILWLSLSPFSVNTYLNLLN